MSKQTGWVQDRETGAYSYAGPPSDLCPSCEQIKHSCQCDEPWGSCPCFDCERRAELKEEARIERWLDSHENDDPWGGRGFEDGDLPF